VSDQHPPPVTGQAALFEWRLAQVEGKAESLNAWREQVAMKLAALELAVADNTGRLNQIGVLTLGTFLTVASGVAIYFLTRGHP
jgi:hypothetical protein